VRVSIRFLCFFLFRRKKNVMSSGHYTTSVFASFYEKEERNVQWTLNDILEVVIDLSLTSSSVSRCVTSLL